MEKTKLVDEEIVAADAVAFGKRLQRRGEVVEKMRVFESIDPPASLFGGILEILARNDPEGEIVDAVDDPPVSPLDGLLELRPSDALEDDVEDAMDDRLQNALKC